jgi:hypothetical protein
MIWKPIPNFPYEASSAGAIRNSRTGRVLRPDTVKGGYQRVTLSIGGVSRRFFVNRLVCEAFNGAPPTEEHQARHLDGKTDRNVPENLKWGTRSENEQDKRLHGTYQEREGNPFARLTEEGVADIRRRYAENLSARQARGFEQVEHGFVLKLAEQYDVSVSCIKFVISRRNWPELKVA